MKTKMKMKPIEFWKFIDGYEGVYQISSIGRVRSFNYCNEGKLGYLSLYAKGRSKNKYVELWYHGTSKRIAVSKLLRLYFPTHM